MELIDFLAARITEDEKTAQVQVDARRERYPEENLTSGGKGYWVDGIRYWVDRGPWLQAEPLHVLAECVAKRAIIEIARPGGDTAAAVSELEAEGIFPLPAGLLATLAPVAQSYEDALNHSLEIVLRLLALPYQSHPDYQQEWKRA